MKIVERISATGASEEDIRKLELHLSVVLPNDYRAFMKDSNGGRPKPNGFEGPNGDGSIVHFFFTLDPDAPHYRLYRKIETYAGRIPDKMLPIGCDDFGNIILIDIGAKSFGAICFWDHEEENMEGSPYWDNISIVSASFTQFVDGFR